MRFEKAAICNTKQKQPYSYNTWVFELLWLCQIQNCIAFCTDADIEDLTCG